MGVYSLFITEQPAPSAGPPYPQAYVDSWRHIITDRLTRAHILEIAHRLRDHARPYYGIRIFAGHDTGKLIFEWTLSEMKGRR